MTTATATAAKPITNDAPQVPATTPPERPSKVGEWTLAKTVEVLSRPLPDQLLKEKTVGGQRIKFLPWHRACGILDKYAPGWEYRVVRVDSVTNTVEVTKQGVTLPGGHDSLVLTVEITLNCSDGKFTRAATGIEAISKTGYGDAASNAESMALRRAASKFGLGRGMYEKG